MGIIEGSNYEGRGLMKGNLGSEKTKMPDRLLPNLMMLCPLNPKINIGICCTPSKIFKKGQTQLNFENNFAFVFVMLRPMFC